MPPIIAANVARIDLLYTQRGQNTENVFYLEDLAGWTATKAGAVRDAFESWHTTSWRPLLPSDTAATGIRFTDMSSVTGYTSVLPFTGAIPGTSGASLPSNVSYSIQKIVAERWRGGHPRLYVPGIPVSDTSGNYVGQTQANEWIAALNTLRDAMEALDGGDVLYGALRTTGGAATPHAPRFVLVTGHRVTDLVLDSQRRRLPGRGR